MPNQLRQKTLGNCDVHLWLRLCLNLFYSHFPANSRCVGSTAKFHSEIASHGIILNTQFTSRAASPTGSLINSFRLRTASPTGNLTHSLRFIISSSTSNLMSFFCFSIASPIGDFTSPYRFRIASPIDDFVLISSVLFVSESHRLPAISPVICVVSLVII